jgi:hypothetical protein
MRISDALMSLRPGAQWSMDDDYSTLKWLDESQTKPLQEEVEAKIRELQQLEPYRLLRIERDRLLKETDWRASSDLNLPESWRSYRQALRDLPANAKPKLDEYDNLDMSSVAWPSPST